MSAPQVDPAELADTIAYLSGLSEDRYATSLADCIMDPPDGAPNDPETQAFRSPELIARSVAAANFLIDHVNTIIRTREPNASERYKDRAREMFRAKVGRERRILESIQAEAELRRGIIRNAPNPRARALRRLKQLHLAEYQELVREETEKLAEERRAARKAAKERARQSRV